MEQGILSILVSNHSGVLTKVSGMFARRGYNIKALSVAETENPAFSRITILVDGDLAQLEQIYRQVSKLEEVKAAKILPNDQVMERELLLVKVSPQNGSAGALMELVTRSHAKVTAIQNGCAIIEASGSIHQIDKLLSQIAPFGILELSRTGMTALAVDDQVLLDQLKQTSSA